MFKNKNKQVRSGLFIPLMLGINAALIFALYYGVDQLLLWHAMRTMPQMDEAAYELYLALYNATNLPLLFAQESIILCVTLVLWRLIVRRPYGQMGLSPLGKHGGQLLCGLGVGAACIAAVFIVLGAAGHVHIASRQPMFSWDIVLYLLLFTLVGFSEEIAFRGYIMQSIPGPRRIWAVVLSSLLFAVLHMGNNAFSLLAFINIALVGIVLALMTLWSGSIWMAIGFHITWNYFQGMVFGFPVSGLPMRGILTSTNVQNNLINGGDFGPEGGLLTTVVMLVLLFALWWYHKGRYTHTKQKAEM